MFYYFYCFVLLYNPHTCGLYIVFFILMMYYKAFFEIFINCKLNKAKKKIFIIYN